MPKAAPSAPSATASVVKAPFQAAHVLRRNQACHQCRRRKLKCDAKRPCSTCVRSHAYAVAHAPAGAELPAHPECTFDDPSETDIQEAEDQPQNRFERLEGRINELEAMLSEKNKALRDKNFQPLKLLGDAQPTNNGDPTMVSVINNMLTVPSSTITEIDSFNPEIANIDFPRFEAANALDNLAGIASLMDASPSGSSETQSGKSASPPALNQFSGDHPTLPSSIGISEILYQSWPKSLPNPGMVRHLVEAYFTFNANATVLFHAPSFFASLSLPPTHPKFPAVSVLHALCAVGSMYTGIVEPTPNPVAADFSPMDPFPDRYKIREGRPDSFAETQVRHARAAVEASVYMGENIFQNIQAKIVLCAWYWANAKWSEAHVSAAQALRYAIPCGLNVCPPFNTIAQVIKPPSLLQPAKSVTEDELRRNAFWLAYGIERTHGCGNSWAMMLDDQDISQLLPVRYDQFEQGILVLPEQRQWSHDHDVLLRHPEEQTDPFILYIKSCILLSRVKNFNLRFRAKHHAGDPSTISVLGANSPPRVNGQDIIDVRSTPAFIELDELVTSFAASYPSHLKHPVRGELVHSHLFTACVAPHVAQILLHETHAMIGRSTCASSRKIIAAARSILNLLHQVTSTSFEISLLGLFPLMAFFMAGRVLARFLRAAIDAKSEEQCTILRAEFEFIHTNITKSGEHIPLADRYSRMLSEFVTQLCGKEYATPLTIAHPIRQQSAQPQLQLPLQSALEKDLFSPPQMFMSDFVTNTSGPLIV